MFVSMDKKLSEIYKGSGKRIRFIRFWEYDNGPVAHVYYYQNDGTPGSDRIRAFVDSGIRLSQARQYDDLLVKEAGDGEYRWVAAYLDGEIVIKL